MMITYQKILITSFLFFLSNQIIAQIDPVNAINELKNGVLIVVIPGNHKKIALLKKELKNPKTKKRQRNRIEKIIDLAEKRRKILIEQMWQGFEKDYHFSEFAFIYDTTTTHILNGRMEKVVFIRDNDKINLKGKPFLFLRYGNTDRGNTTGIESWVVTNHQFDDLEKPFPYYVPVYIPFKHFLSALVSYPSIVVKIGNKKKEIGYALNKKFENYYNAMGRIAN